MFCTSLVLNSEQNCAASMLKTSYTKHFRFADGGFSRQHAFNYFQEIANMADVESLGNQIRTYIM